MITKVDSELVKYLLRNSPEIVNISICMEEPAELMEALPYKHPTIINRLVQMIKKMSKAFRSTEQELDLFTHTQRIDELTEEMADVCIVIAMLQEMFLISDKELQGWINKKMDRNIERCY